MKMVQNCILFISLLIFAFASDTLAGNCNFDVKLTQSLLSEGFHRNITYGLVFNTENDRDQWLYKDCLVGFEQHLPAGIFVNPDQLADLKMGQKLNTLLKTKVNTENPAEHSDPFNIYMIDVVTEGKVYLGLPVHARYHKAVAGGGMVRIEIPAPRVYLRCPDARLSACEGETSSHLAVLCNGSAKEDCFWKEIPYTLMSDPITWDVPVGNLDHFYIVASGTAIIIILGSLYLLKTIHEYKVKETKKKRN